MRRLLLLLVCLAACSTPGAKKVDRPPDQQAQVDEAIKNREVRLGMTESEVLAAWGQPKRKRKATHRRKPVVIWSYVYSEIYFDRDGFVVDMSAPGY
jgi:outer membrane protein assembly factor BamE (lipoprotein component of BamABCDE complex)